jgi:hypothetical protein
MPDTYAYYLFAEELPELYGAINREAIVLRRAGHEALAARLLRAYDILVKDLEYLSNAIAGAGTVKLVERERSTRVRPDSLGDGGPRLEDYLQCDPLSELPGSVGIANEEVLDAGVPWWPTNEEGSSARVGGRIFGLFYGSGLSNSQAPDPGEFRQHSVFKATSVEGAGPGIIEAPIPARRFIRDAIPEIEVRWKKGFEAAKGKLEEVITAVFADLAKEKAAQEANRDIDRNIRSLL